MMISETVFESYQQLLSACEALLVNLEDSNIGEVLANQKVLQKEFQSLLAASSPSERQQLQQYNTEIHKEIQMLAPDISRWQITMQADKKEQRQAAIRVRGDRLKTYITTLLSAANES